MRWFGTFVYSEMAVNGRKSLNLEHLLDLYIYIYIYRCLIGFKSGWYVGGVFRHVLIWILTIFLGFVVLQKPANFCLLSWHLKLLLVFWNFDGFWRNFLVLTRFMTKISYDFSFAWFFFVKKGLNLGLWSSKSILAFVYIWNFC